MLSLISPAARPARAVLIGAALAAIALAELKPETLAAYKNYVAQQERRIAEQKSLTGYLWLGRDATRLQSARDGHVPVERMTPPEVPGGLVEHWVGGAFLPNTTLQKVKALDQDYARYKILYAPDIVDSKILSRKGDQFQVYYRIKKKKVFTVVLDTVHDIQFVQPAPNRLSVSSRSTRVQEVKDAGESSQKVLPVGEGDGFLWAMNSYWRMEERDGGVMVECEAITLARSIPAGLGNVVGPVINSFAAESLTNTLTLKRRAVQAQK